jgi:hypothetical protein
VLNLNQSINFTHSHLIDKDNNGNTNEKLFPVPPQCNQNFNQQNPCMINPHDKNNVTIFHQNMWFTWERGKKKKRPLFAKIT